MFAIETGFQNAKFCLITKIYASFIRVSVDDIEATWKLDVKVVDINFSQKHYVLCIVQKIWVVGIGWSVRVTYQPTFNGGLRFVTSMSTHPSWTKGL